MKHFLLIITLNLVSISCFAQYISYDGLNLKIDINIHLEEYNDTDSALNILTELSTQQFRPVPTQIEITKDYVSQKRPGQRKYKVYYKNISHITIKKSSVWRIYLLCKDQGVEELFIFNDRDNCEDAFNAILCLIHGSRQN